MKVPVWGWSNPGSGITVTFAGKPNVNTLSSDVAKTNSPSANIQSIPLIDPTS
jgi:hypothetical protein